MEGSLIRIPPVQRGEAHEAGAGKRLLMFPPGSIHTSNPFTAVMEREPGPPTKKRYSDSVRPTLPHIAALCRTRRINQVKSDRAPNEICIYNSGLLYTTLGLLALNAAQHISFIKIQEKVLFSSFHFLWLQQENGYFTFLNSSTVSLDRSPYWLQVPCAKNGPFIGLSKFFKLLITEKKVCYTNKVIC